jgi:acyl-CoA thioester hydrolase
MSMELPSFVVECKTLVEISVAWNEMDAFGHVNNCNYFKYFEIARWQYFIKIGVYERFFNANSGCLLQSTSCNYIQPLHFPDTIFCGISTIEMTAKSMIQEHFILNGKNQLAAIGNSTMVYYDFIKGKKIDFPDDIVLLIRKYEENNN